MTFSQKSVTSEKMTILNVIWGSITISVVVAGGAGYFLATQGIVPPVVEGDMAQIMIAGMAIVSLFLILAGYKVSEMISRTRDSSRQASYESEEQMVRELFPRYLQICVSRWALFEGVGIMGLACLLLAGMEYLPHTGVFFTISIWFLIKTSPSIVELKQLADRRAGA
ncbi:MAG: hypothetical protein OEZ32_06850 [Nitrospinota bacterium]|nr:hypothetical protein [Nitrospinota bacterium]